MGSDGGSLEIRSPRPNELDAFANCGDASFGVHLGGRERERFLDSLETARSLACFDGGELVGTLSALQVRQTLPGLVLAPTTALANIAVLPTHRRRGILTALLRRALEEAHERNEVTAILEASSGALYGQFGFGPASWSACYWLDPSSAALLPELTSTKGTVRLLDVGEAGEVLPAVFDRACRLRSGELARSPLWWDEFLEEGELSDSSVRFFAVHEENDEIDGYVVYDRSTGRSRRGENEVLVVDLYATSDAAGVRLWSLLFSLDAASLRTLERPVDEPIRHALEDPRSLQVLEVRDGTWLRLVDVAAALCSRRYCGPGSLVLSVHDTGCPWNEGRYLLEVDDEGIAAVARSTASPDLELDVRALASLYLGGAAPSVLASAGRLLEHHPGCLQRADLLFRSARAPFASAYP